MHMLPGRVLAVVILGRSLATAAFKQLFGRRPDLAVFKANYAEDRLPAVTPDERARLDDFSRCFACGRCDVGEGERMAASGGEYAGIMSFVLAASRSMPDFDAAVRSLAWVDDGLLLEKDAICPAFVPISALARFVRAKAQSSVQVSLDAHPSLGPGASGQGRGA